MTALETSKAHARRVREGFFDKYIQGKGIDIGCSTDPLTPDCDRWDISLGNPDATFMEGIPNNTYDWVYSSHLLEHLTDPITAIQNWWRILKPLGHLILYVPHRNLYEKKRTLPSRFNADHKYFITLHDNEPPCTFGLSGMICHALSETCALQIDYLALCNEGWDPNIPTDQHSCGEYSIEAVIQKRH